MTPTLVHSLGGERENECTTHMRASHTHKLRGQLAKFDRPPAAAVDPPMQLADVENQTVLSLISASFTFHPIQCNISEYKTNWLISGVSLSNVNCIGVIICMSWVIIRLLLPLSATVNSFSFFCRISSLFEPPPPLSLRSAHCSRRLRYVY